MSQLKKVISVILSLVLMVSLAASCSMSKCKTAKVISINLTEEEYAFGVDKDQPELLAEVNSFIDDIMADGTFEEICKHHFGDGEPVLVESAPEDDSKDQLKIATNAAFEPFEYMVGDLYTGIDIEIAKLLADRLGKELVIMNMDFESVCLSIGQHKADIAMAGLTVKPEREEYVTFSNTYYYASQRIVVPEDCTAFDGCTSASDIEAILKADSKLRVGVQAGTTGQFYCEGDADWGFDGFSFATITYKNGSLAIQDMINGNIDYVIIDSAPADAITASINELAN